MTMMFDVCRYFGWIGFRAGTGGDGTDIEQYEKIYKCTPRTGSLIDYHVMMYSSDKICVPDLVDLVCNIYKL